MYNIELTLFTEMVRDGYVFRLLSATIKSRQPKYAVVTVIPVNQNNSKL
jgi:hypothetical protein